VIRALRSGEVPGTPFNPGPSREISLRGIKRFGEVPGRPFKPSPDQGDFQTHWGLYGPHSGAGSLPATGSAPKPGPAGNAAVSVPAVPAISPPAQIPGEEPGAGSGSEQGLLGWFRRVQGWSERPSGPSEWMGPRRGEGAVVRSRSEPEQALGEPETDADLRRFSLWAGLNAPMILPAQRVWELTPTQAMVQGRADYARRILGEIAVRPVPAGDGMRMPEPAEASESESEAEARFRGMFAEVDMDVSRHGGDFRDAVAALSRTAGFSQDARFPAVLSGPDHGRLRVWGWLPPDRLASAMGLPSVTRLETTGVPRPAPPEESDQARLLVALRLPRSSLPEEFLPSAVRRLYDESGFAWGRAIGIQRIPNSQENALIVSGRIPVRNIHRLLADPAVVKVMPLAAADAEAPQEPPAMQSSWPGRFLAYAMARYPVLLIVTLLLAGALVVGPVSSGIFRQ